MNEQKAREILGEIVQPDNALYNLGHYISWPHESYAGEENSICLDDSFTISELEAVVWWMRNKTVRQQKHCEVCNTPILLGARTDTKTCSHKCRLKLSRSNKKK